MERIAFVLSTFPTLTETFVAGELKLLLSVFPGSKIYSLRKPFDKTLHRESEELMKKTHYLPEPSSASTLGSNLALFWRKPLKYISTVLYLITHTFTNPLHMLKTLYIFPQAVHLSRLLTSEAVNHIHSHWSGYPTTVALTLHKLTGIPFSFTSHACDMSMIRTLVKEKIRLASFVVTCTQDALDDLSGEIPEHLLRKITVNYHGSNLEKFRPEFRQKKQDSIPLILTVSDLHERKGLPYLLEALSLLQREQVEFRSVIVGEGPLRPLLERMMKDLHLEDRLVMPGAVTQESLVDEYYSNADLFVLPCMVQRMRFFKKNMDLSRYKILECKMSGGLAIQKDGIPNVLVEAMAMKIPVISTPVGGIRELIRHGQNGILVPEKDPATLGAEMASLLLDQRRALILGENGYQTVHARFNRGKNIRELVDVFRKGVMASDHKITVEYEDQEPWTGRIQGSFRGSSPKAN